MASQFLFRTSTFTLPILCAAGVYSLTEMAWTNRRLEIQEKLYKEGLSDQEINRVNDRLPFGPKIQVEDNLKIMSLKSLKNS